MNNKEKVFGLIIMLGLIIGIIVMYVTMISNIYGIKRDTEQLIKDHRVTTCTVAKGKDGGNYIICYPEEIELEGTTETSNL